MFTTNAINTPNGGFAADETDAELTGTALWIDFPEQKLALDPGESKKVNLTVSIPADTPAGFYVAALVAETTESLEIHGTDAFRQFIRSAMSVEITVPGEMTSGFELGEPALTPVGQQWMLNIPIINTGTARLRPRGELILSTPDGTEISSSLVEMGSFYGGSTTSVRVLLPAQLPYGEYLVSLTLTDEETGATDAIQSAQISLVDPGVADETIFVVEDASVTPNGDPIRYADISATITNNGPTISTANITLNVFRDGEEIESYPLAQNQALPQGTTEFSQRYIPLDDWQSGTWTFELVIASVDGGTETILATIDVEDQIVVP